MKRFLWLLLLPASCFAQPQDARFDVAAAERFAKLALACVHQEYPNKISHTMNSDADTGTPRQLTPAFYGCYDWHSSVHGHWLLARLARTYPRASFAPAARAALKKSITKENIAAEVKYLNATGRASFERPYGLAWLLQLAAELHEWKTGGRPPILGSPGPSGVTPPVEMRHADPVAEKEAADLEQTLAPLELAAVERLKTWLPKLSHPVRSGEHSQTAFALGLMLDYAKRSGDAAFERLLVDKALAFYLGDKNCPLNYEPSGEDFLSPCLAEADLMRRVLAKDEYIKWLTAFLPALTAATTDGWGDWLKPAVVTDPSDPKLAHLDGLNLSRAWMLEGIASAVSPPTFSPDPSGAKFPKRRRVNPGRARLEAAAKAHREAGLASVAGAHYEGGHWLGSFAVYLVTQRGITLPR